MKVLIIEDELLGAEALRNLLVQADARIEVLGVKESIGASVAWLAAHEAPDLIFMDIELADGQCFEIFREVEVKSPVIFTTSYDAYALKAFRFNSIDYLLKPISLEALQQSLAKVEGLKQQLARPGLQPGWEALVRQFSSTVPLTGYRDRFLVRKGASFNSVEVADIAYFFTKGKVSFIRCNNGREYFLDYTLEQLYPMLSPKQFYRLNRQVIAAHSSIVLVSTWFNGKLKVELTPAMETEVVISREKAREFRQWMGE